MKYRTNIKIQLKMTCGPLKYTKPLVMLPKPQTVEKAMKARVSHEIFVAFSLLDIRIIPLFLLHTGRKFL